jgi:hypothetical protein
MCLKTVFLHINRGYITSSEKHVVGTFLSPSFLRFYRRTPDGDHFRSYYVAFENNNKSFVLEGIV